MKRFAFCFGPVEFNVESDCDTPMEALRQELQCETPDVLRVLKYLVDNIEDDYCLDDCVECLFVDED